MPGTDTPFQPTSRRRDLCHTAPTGTWTDKMVAGITWIQAAKSETWEGFGQEVWAQRGESNIHADAASVRGMTEAAKSRLRRNAFSPFGLRAVVQPRAGEASSDCATLSGRGRDLRVRSDAGLGGGGGGGARGRRAPRRDGRVKGSASAVRGGVCPPVFRGRAGA